MASFVTAAPTAFPAKPPSKQGLTRIGEGERLGSFVAFFINGRGFVRHVFLRAWVRSPRHSLDQWVRFAKKLHRPILLAPNELRKPISTARTFISSPHTPQTTAREFGFVRRIFGRAPWVRSPRFASKQRVPHYRPLTTDKRQLTTDNRQIHYPTIPYYVRCLRRCAFFPGLSESRNQDN